MNRRNAIEAAVFVSLVALGAASRIVEWIPPNFQAITAATLFAGFFFRSRVPAVAVPLIAMMISDAVIGGYSRGVMITVYSALVLPVAFSGYLRRSLNPWRLTGAALVCSVVFYLATNAAVWPTMYEHSLAGLMQSYARALPFFKMTVLSDLAYSWAIFGAYALASYAVRQAASEPKLLAEQA